jgi:hypothetical protein
MSINMRNLKNNARENNKFFIFSSKNLSFLKITAPADFSTGIVFQYYKTLKPKIKVGPPEEFIRNL